MSNYEYPRLPRKEIVQVLSQFGIASVTENEISNPKSLVVLDLYTRILNHLDFLPEEDNDQLQFDSLERLENPDLHLGSVRVIKIYHKIKQMLTGLECPNKFTFNMADLVKPDPHRTEFFLGALLNFCLYRDSRMNSISPIVDEFNDLEQKILDIENTKIVQLKLAIAEIKEARERDMPSVQEVDAKVKELRQTIANLNNEQMSLRTTLKKLKEKNVEMDDKISGAEFRLVQNVQGNGNLQSKIVQSPNKVQRALEEKKLAREVARNAERLAMHTFHEKTSHVEVLSKVHKKMSKHYRQMQAIQEQVSSSKSVEKDLKAIKAKLGDEEVLEKSLDVKLVEMQSKVEHLEGSKKQLEKECSSVTEEGTKYLSSKKSEVESKRLVIETRQRNVEAMLSKVDAVNSTITSVKKSATVKVDQLDGKRREIVEEFHKYSNSIAHVVESGLKDATIKGAGFDN
ncbi:unnamed protein product [Trifolium pratense]|uniref:Uncharacterized protein n=1 Tax=Trifolium pratense TaxID=57577 RepID=A0ACB0K6H8_TRIPR|nr:unnamed protein product [Trifolium pratense]